MASILNALKQLQQNGVSFAEPTPASTDECELPGLKQASAEPPERRKEQQQPVSPTETTRSAKTKIASKKALALELPIRSSSELPRPSAAQNVRTYEQIVDEADDTLDHLVELVEHQNSSWELPAATTRLPTSRETALSHAEIEIEHSPNEIATENPSQFAPETNEQIIDSDGLSYEQAVTDIVIGGTSYSDRSEATEAIAGAIAVLSLPLDCVGVDCIDAGITSSELVPIEDDTEFDVATELVEDEPIRSDVDAEWTAEEFSQAELDLPAVAEPVASVADFAITDPTPLRPLAPAEENPGDRIEEDADLPPAEDAAPIVASEPLASTITEPLPARQELANELASPSLNESPSVPSDELLPEDILSVLAEVERNHESHDPLASSRVVAVPSLQIPSSRRTTNIRSLDRNANATLSQQAMDMLLSEAATAFPAGWQEPETSPSYADLLADEPLEELADWGYLVNAVEPHSERTAVDTSETQAVSPPRPSLQPEEIRSPGLELPRRPLATRPIGTQQEMEAEANSESAGFEYTAESADILPLVQPAGTPISPTAASAKSMSPTAFEFELMRQLDDNAVRSRYLELAENLWPISSSAAIKQRTVILCSADPDAHAAHTIARLATLYSAERQLPVLMIDANLTQQYLTKGYLAQGEAGFADLLSGGTQSTPERAAPLAPLRSTSNGGVTLLPAGGRIDRRRIEIDTVRQRVTELGEQYPLILIDGGVASDELAAKIAHGGDDVYLVVQIGKTTRQTAEQAKASLIAAGITPAGCVATNVPIAP